MKRNIKNIKTIMNDLNCGYCEAEKTLRLFEKGVLSDESMKYYLHRKIFNDGPCSECSIAGDKWKEYAECWKCPDH